MGRRAAPARASGSRCWTPGWTPPIPDLADRIVASRSFIEGEDVIDRNGHGTHTASTVAGTGAASDGKEQGVAPAPTWSWARSSATAAPATISGIIAGMEWAARTEHAKVINMSLGTGAGTPRTTR